ncbi:hypothetical protein OG474_19960 [Kribbella sp. NBC_01505]|uniref:hypothetical protein n=1 Tax=Kribbella sp. NBC_01505 TaxID=2903580 RepID=UPI00386997F9
MARRDLDAWAVALGVSDDDAAIHRLAQLERLTKELQDQYAQICDRLRGLDERGLAARAADRFDAANERLFWVKRDFLLHERGL